MSLRRSLRARAGRDDPSVIESNMSTRSTRQSRATQPLPSVTVVRAPSESPDGTRKSIHLTVRMPSSKLREATSGSSRSAAARRSYNVFTDNPIVTGPRTSRSKKKLVEINTSDEEEEEQDLEDQEEDEVDDEDAPEEEEDDDEDADGEGDVDMDDAPPQPPVSRRHTKAAVASGPRGKPLKSVEAKEVELDEEDEEEDEEELSEPDSDADGEADDQEEGLTLNMDEAGEPDEDEEDEELDSDGEMPDMSKLTKRQRGSLGNDFLQLPMEPQIKKHLTAEERAMRRAEMARRRKNLSEKRNEEEKMDTINRLLRKQAPKRRGRIPAAEAAENAAADQEAAAESESVDPTMVRWISGREGSRVAVPEEWIGTPQGRFFEGTPKRLVEEL